MTSHIELAAKFLGLVGVEGSVPTIYQPGTANRPADATLGKGIALVVDVGDGDLLGPRTTDEIREIICVASIPTAGIEFV